MASKDPFGELSPRRGLPPGLKQRFADRVLVMTTDRCFGLCPHCTRKFILGQAAVVSTDEDLRRCVAYVTRHPKVRDVQVIGVPDQQYGEEIMACIILKEGETMTVEEMKQYILDHMARHKVPRYIDFVEKFPMNAAGKILKYKMREEAAERLGLKK